MKIQFTDVGRSKASWIAEIDTDQPDEGVLNEIALEVKEHGVLISRHIDITYTENWNGRIYAGFHKVGTFHEHKGETA